MPTFIILGKLTAKAIGNLKTIAERDAKAGEIIRAAGGHLLGLYYTFGRYDFVALLDMPSAEALAGVLFEIGTWETVTTETLTALSPEQVYQVAKGKRK
jgi:uncharacterized protein with GYD domain